MTTNADRTDTKPRQACPAETGTILPFRPRTSAIAPLPVVAPNEPTTAEEADDFRHRMFVNAAGLLCAGLLIASGIWLASSIASLRNTQDCYLSGRRNCAPIPAADKIPFAGQH